VIKKIEEGDSMKWDLFTNQLKEIFVGNMLLIICSVFYLTWWGITFFPKSKMGDFGGKSAILLFLTMIFGFAGIGVSIHGICITEQKYGLISGNKIVLGGVLAYIILLICTQNFFHRQVTTELILIIGWGMLELEILNILSGLAHFTISQIQIFGLFLFLAVIVSLVLYILYYQLGKTESYICGMIPLMIGAIYLIIIEVFIVKQITHV